MPAQKSAHDMPPGIGVEAQFFSWHSQYIWHAGELVAAEPPAPALEPPAVEAPALELSAPEPTALAPALAVAAPPAPAELDAPPESLDPQPRAIADDEMAAMRATRESDRM